MPRSRSALRTLGAAARLTLLATVVLGVAYPLAVRGIAQTAFPAQANGSLVHVDGRPVGSALLAAPTPTAGADRWFRSRPSAVDAGRDAPASGGSQLGPDDPALVRSIEERRAALAREDGVSPASVPADALTESGSGLDPDISPAYALEQVDRVASARGLPASTVRRLVAESIRPREAGFLGAPRVNVLELNVALAALG